MEIDKQMLNLADEKKAIEFKLCESIERNKDCFSNSNNDNEKNISNDNTQSSNNNANSNNIFEEEEEEEEEDEDEEEIFSEIQIPDFYRDSSTQNEQHILNEEIFKNYDTLKFFFEETWDVEFLKSPILVPDNQITDREKVAYKKMCFFVNRHYINDYEEQIQKASLN